MTFGNQLVYATAHVAAAYYFWALAAEPESACRRRRWTLGWLFFIAHLAAAFHFAHHWSHAAAAAATTRRTAELLGTPYPYGIYFNYAFAIVWTLDVAWLRLAPASYARRSRPIPWLIHGFLAFMMFNAVVVFGRGWVRALGIGAIAAVILIRVRRRLAIRRAQPYNPAP